MCKVHRFFQGAGALGLVQAARHRPRSVTVAAMLRLMTLVCKDVLGIDSGAFEHKKFAMTLDDTARLSNQ